MTREYHLTHDDPCLPHWPNGAWSVYRISGDQIADRVVREKINPKGYYEGKVIARHSWCGYMGMYETMAEAMKAIEDEDALYPTTYMAAIATATGGG